jgi:hypothetical protein
MKIFLTSLNDINKSKTEYKHISHVSKTFETVSDALAFRDSILFDFSILYPKGTQILDCSIYEIELDSETYKIKNMRSIEAKY